MRGLFIRQEESRRAQASGHSKLAGTSHRLLNLQIPGNFQGTIIQHRHSNDTATYCQAAAGLLLQIPTHHQPGSCTVFQCIGRVPPDRHVANGNLLLQQNVTGCLSTQDNIRAIHISKTEAIVHPVLRCVIPSTITALIRPGSINGTMLVQHLQLTITPLCILIPP